MDNTTPDVVVPVEPTEAMLDAWHEAVANGIFGENGDGGKPHPEYIRDAYSAMLAARPAATPGGEREAVARIVRSAIARRMRAEVDPVRSFSIEHRLSERDAAVSEATDAILAALSRPAPVAGEAALLLKLIDTLKPLASVAERFRDCAVVEISKPHADNPSPDILPMPREWFDRAADDMEAIVIQLHAKGALSEGQASTMTGLDRVEVRKLADAHATPTPEPAAPDAAGEDGAVGLLKRLKSSLMQTRRFGVDDLATWRRACTSTEGDIEEWLIDHGHQKSDQRPALRARSSDPQDYEDVLREGLNERGLAVPPLPQPEIRSSEPGGGAVLPSISLDGPNLPGEQRQWLARQLLDSRLDDSEAFSAVAFHPDVKDATTPHPGASSSEPADARGGAFKIGDRVTKTKGSSWTGRVVGFYSTNLTPEGYAVESETETGSVQIYPAAALSAKGDE